MSLPLKASLDLIDIKMQLYIQLRHLMARTDLNLGERIDARNLARAYYKACRMLAQDAWPMEE